LAVTATLAACSNGGSNSSGSQSASASASSSVGSLTVWADDTRYSQIQELAKDFTAATKVDVQVVQKSETNMDQEFISQVPTGNGPDVIVMAHDKLGQMVKNGVVSPVDLGDAKSKFSEAAIQGVTYDGKTYGVPYAVESVALVRNNKLTSDSPKTFDEMVASGKKAGSEYPFVVQMGTDGDPYHLYAFESSFGNEVFKQSADGSYTSDLTLGGAGASEFTQWLKEQGVVADVVQGAKTKDLVILEEEMRALVGDHLYITTDDGSYGFHGLVTAKVEELVEKEGKHYDLCVAIGPMIMMKFVSLLTKKLGIPTIASMNPIMVDGTGMCGACRLIVGDEVKFACVDGPEFDAHLIDFDQAMKRARMYASEEGREYLKYKEGKTHHGGCGNCGGQQ